MASSVVLPGNMERQTEGAEVITASQLRPRRSEMNFVATEGSLRAQSGSPRATPASETDISNWAREEPPPKLQGRADAES